MHSGIPKNGKYIEKDLYLILRTITETEQFFYTIFAKVKPVG